MSEWTWADNGAELKAECIWVCSYVVYITYIYILHMCLLWLWQNQRCTFVCVCVCNPFGAPPAACKFIKDMVTQWMTLEKVNSGATYTFMEALSMCKTHTHTHTLIYLFLCIHSPAFRRVAMTHLQIVVVIAVAVDVAACGAHFRLLSFYAAISV